MLAATIIGILLSTALLGVALWWVAKVGNRAIRDAAYRRRILFAGGLVYAIGGVVIMVEVAIGKERVEALFGLPIGLLMAWFLLRTAIRIKVSSDDSHLAGK